ncbi:hypothetical protein Y032_0086g1970 [Ancylostoma ceylanicum]|uniref:UBA domain-containing protein n=1 Tax=Ancylostoma ceylanicum TaxID=53326 RepID=A0A016TQ27_9BILA|nr:hypothetical protein Y032_0086g1970 [Ancylostoma ceylanicum]
MSTVVDQLVDMGFERSRAEYAFAQTGKGALEAVSLTSYSHVFMFFLTNMVMMRTSSFLPKYAQLSASFFSLVGRVGGFKVTVVSTNKTALFC